ncbi:MAG: putative metal-binding motif-containing protein [Myxococcota bacterium]
MWWIVLPAAWAGPDVFGLGTGADGDLTVTDTQVVNVYSPVVEASLAGASELDVADGASFPPGTLLVVHQTLGDAAPVTFVQPPPVLDHLQLGVGATEYARVLQQNGDTLVLNAPLLNGYGPGAQVVRVPEYSSVTVLSGALAAEPWNGTTGGILAFAVDGPVVLTGDLDVSGQGFRGAGVDGNAGFDASCTASLDDLGEAAPKGEGGPGYGGVGRGTSGNGGGGGNCANAGGGGGGNGGYGGRGGFGRADSGSLDRGGYGGRAASPSTTGYALLGGGGGAADADDHANSSRGGAGGGVVLVRARSITGVGRVRAAGVAGINTLDDGASGGGAGGTVVLSVADTLECLGVEAPGARGGNVANGLLLPGVGHGPGGGGGGGRVVLQGASILCPANVAGGAAGVFLVNDPFGAQPGQAGASLEQGAIYEDADGDGVIAGPGGGPDCDDGDPTSAPGMPEVCDGADNDCNGPADDGLPVVTVYEDLDGDGFGDPASPAMDCGPMSGFVLDGTDCDDSDPDVFPGAPEVAGDGTDQDCDGMDGPDDPPIDTDTDTDDTDPEVVRRSSGCTCSANSPVFTGLWAFLVPLIAARRR